MGGCRFPRPRRRCLVSALVIRGGGYGCIANRKTAPRRDGETRDEIFRHCQEASGKTRSALRKVPRKRRNGITRAEVGEERVQGFRRGEVLDSFMRRCGYGTRGLYKLRDRDTV